MSVTQPHSGTTNDTVSVNEAQGTLVPVDRSLLITLVRYFVENDLLDSFDEYLENNGCYEAVMDVNMVNHAKRFLQAVGKTDATAKMAMLAHFGGIGAGGSPTGIRG